MIALLENKDEKYKAIFKKAPEDLRQLIQVDAFKTSQDEIRKINQIITGENISQKEQKPSSFDFFNGEKPKKEENKNVDILSLNFNDLEIKKENPNKLEPNLLENQELFSNLEVKKAPCADTKKTSSAFGFMAAPAPKTEDKLPSLLEDELIDFSAGNNPAPKKHSFSAIDQISVSNQPYNQPPIYAQPRTVMQYPVSIYPAKDTSNKSANEKYFGFIDDAL
jgi:hypothetical protein